MAGTTGTQRLPAEVYDDHAELAATTQPFLYFKARSNLNFSKRRPLQGK